MSRILPSVDPSANGDTFQILFDKVNNVINLIGTSVVTTSNTANAENTVGNAYIVGNFGATMLYSDTITAKGNVITINSVSNFPANSSFARISVGSNVVINSTSINIGSSYINTSKAYAANIVSTSFEIANTLSITASGISFANVALNPVLVNKRMGVQVVGSAIGERSWINFVAGAGTNISVTDNANNNSVDVSVSISTNGVSAVLTTTTNVTSNTTSVIDQFNANTFRCASYLVSLTDRNNANYQVSNILLVHDGADAYMTEFGTIFTLSTLGTFSSAISGGVISLSYTPTSNNVGVKLTKTVLVV